MRRRFGTELLPFQIVLAVTSMAVGGIVAVFAELRDELGFSETQVGIVVAAGFLGSFVAQLAFGGLADAGHGRPMAIIGIGLASLGLFAMVFVDSVWLWVAARGLLGFAVGLVVPGIKRAAAVLDPENVGENLGRLVVGDISGLLIGPAGVGVLNELFGFRAPFLVLAVLTVLFLPYVARLPEDRGERDRVRRATAFDLLRIRRLQGALLLVFGYFALIGAWESVMPVMFSDRGGSPLTTGIAFTLFGVPMVLFSPLAGRMSDRLGPPRVAIGALVVIALGSMTYGFIYALPALITVQAVLGIADAFGFTANQVAVSRAVPEHRQAGALGLMGAVQVLAAGTMALPFAALYEQTDGEATWVVVGAFMLLLTGAGAARLRGTSPARAL